MKRTQFITCLTMLSTCLLLQAMPAATTAPKEKPPAAPKDTVAQQGYRIDQPGTITFTVGMVIKGKVEKPQVMIFLPKEKSYFREQEFSHSFRDELSQPLPFSPLLE
jgi:hypothetical protein